MKILTGNGDYQISIPEGADKFLEVGELSGQVIPLTAKFETGADPVNITITDKKGKTITIPVVVNIVDLTLKVMKPLLPNRMPNLNISLLREVMADIVSLIRWETASLLRMQRLWKLLKKRT